MNMAAVAGENLGPLRVGWAVDESRRHRAAVFLDRDGVLNEVPGDGSTARSPLAEAELRITRAAPAAVARLGAAGFVLVVVTNQPDVRRGLMSLGTATALTRRVVEVLGLDDGYVCPHDGPDRCPCRKPAPGLLLRAASDWGLDLTRSWLIGDRWVDIGAADAAGVRSILLERPYSWDPSGGGVAPPGLAPGAAVGDLDAAVETVLSEPLR
jgi:D-glycero-D-manno-heptose 1,7-bisphosphate phosphatase